MKYLFILLIVSCMGVDCQNKHHGVRRDNRHELKIAAEMASKYADGNFDIIMYGDTAMIIGDKIIYKYSEELPENKSINKIELEPGNWYWAAPIGFTIGINNYKWVVIKDTAFKEGASIIMMDTLKMLELEKLGILKRK